MRDRIKQPGCGSVIFRLILLMAVIGTIMTFCMADKPTEPIPPNPYAPTQPRLR